MKHPTRCMLWGGYGCGNVGDELALAIALRDMQGSFGDSVAVLSRVPGYTKALFPSVKVLAYTPSTGRPPAAPNLMTRIGRRLRRRVPPPWLRFDPQEQLQSKESRGWAQAIRDCEILYLVGGGYLTDVFDYEYLLAPVELAQFSGVPIATAPLGIGPFRRPANGRRVRNALRGALVKVRDEDSLSTCRRLGMVVEHHPDDGFRVREAMELRVPARANNGRVGVNFYPQHGATNHEAARKWWQAVVRELHTAGFALEGFCFHNAWQADFEQTVRLFVDAGLPAEQVRWPDWDYREACRQLLDYQCIVTARFHAAVVAGAAGIPTIAVADGPYYQPKMAAASADRARSRAVHWDEVEPRTVVDWVKAWMGAGNDVRQRGSGPQTKTG